MMKSTLIAAFLLAALALTTGFASPEAHPARATTGDGTGATQAAVDVAVRQVLKGYLAALNRGDFEAAAAYWSPRAEVKPANLMAAGVSEWFFISSEMIDSTATSARVQLNFSVKVAPGARTTYQNGRNVRFVRLSLEQGAWKIQSMTTSP
ncbi:MAG TPA: hypothetical protein VNT01_17590 [Symbiobacteriaceae bacterium]|nr:hypothetical protein [Symbiobacteriaceae bacterium]